MTAKHILYIHPSNELYGADRSLLRLVQRLDRSRYVPHVAVANDLPYEGLLTNELKKAGISHVTVNMSVLRRRYFNAPGALAFAGRTVASTKELVSYVRRNRIGLIHSNSIAVPVGGFVSRLTQTPHIWHVREIITQPAWISGLIARLLYHFSSRVVAVSQPVRQHLLTVYPQLELKTVVIHNGLDLTPFDQIDPDARNSIRRQWGASSDTTVVGMVGRISAWKGQDFLAQAIARLVQQTQNVKLVFVGGAIPGEDEHRQRLEQTLKELNLLEYTHIEDFRTDIPKVLSGFDIFVLPSVRPDPFPTVVLEAMAVGLPVIATAHGGSLEQVVHGETGLLVAPDDPTEMAAAIYLLAQNPDTACRMGKNGRLRIERKFTVSTYVDRLEDLYQEYL